MSNSSWFVPDSPSPPTSLEAEPPPNSPSPSPWSLGWYYIIETLADSKAHLPLLKELVNRLPNFYTDAPQLVQERLELRYLEECASTGRGIVDTKDNTAAATAIDISQPTLDFLCHNFKRPTDPCQPSGSRIALVSNHIRQFISQKRSTLPKPSIQLVAGLHRRNMLPWSAEEENALREGMKTADGRIPWSAILQLYRNHVFHKTRFPNDLKDKWRNIMKKEES